VSPGYEKGGRKKGTKKTASALPRPPQYLRVILNKKKAEQGRERLGSGEKEKRELGQKISSLTGSGQTFHKNKGSNLICKVVKFHFGFWGLGGVGGGGNLGGGKKK